MPRLTRVTRCTRFPRNPAGRDFVVGDLHGQRALFERELERRAFDPVRDRVFCVGDLVDRGPDSLGTLALLDEPWFHAVLGNHELMLLNYLGYFVSRHHSRKSYPSGGGRWILDAQARDRRKVARYAERVASLPLSIHVDADAAFNVMHGDLAPLGDSQEVLFAADTIGVHDADLATMSRRHFAQALKASLERLRFSNHTVQVSATAIGRMPLTYAGHSPVSHVTVHNSYVYVEQGVNSPAGGRAADIPPTLLDHAQFSRWLAGAMVARGQAVRAEPRGSVGATRLGLPAWPSLRTA